MLSILGTVFFALALVHILTWNRYDAEELLSTDEFGKVVDSYEGEAYMVLLTATPSGKKVRALCFEEVLFGHYAKEPVFTRQYTDKSYETKYLELESRKKWERIRASLLNTESPLKERVSRSFMEIIWRMNMNMTVRMDAFLEYGT